MSDLLKQRIELTCTCGARVRATLSDVRANRIIRCPRGHTIELRDDGGGIRKADRALDDLQRKLRNVERQLRRR